MDELVGALPGRRVWSVAALIAAVAEVVDAGFAACTVRGEISGFSRAASGHCYFNLKDPDAGAALRCAMFRRAAQLAGWLPKDGDAVELRGRLAVYEPRGELQFVVEAMQRSGAGALYERFLRLKALLEAEGLFDVAAKRALPAFPLAVGVVTSLGGAALHDVATTLALRSPHVRVVVYPSLVQGSDATASLCAAIAIAAARAEVEVLIVCRGGGSLEDLWAFNDERVVRALRATPMPVVSGVGHETDVTLADLAADHRAPTPTGAAGLVAAATGPALELLESHRAALARRTRSGLEREAQRLDRIALRLARPGETLARRGHGLDLLAQRLGAAAGRDLARRGAAIEARAARAHSLLLRALERQAGRLGSAAIRLEAVDPTRVLARGYALLRGADGHALSSVGQLQPDMAVRATLQDGDADLEVRSVPPATPAA
ncbi:MAG: exodeoxyribonuclease VII large subunit [Caldimonas sp.]